MEWGSSSEIEYAFNGKEKMEAHGFNMYDYGARFYDQTLARWHSMDPLAEKYYSVSPYAYCAGNPVMFVDPDGRFIATTIGTIVGGAKGAFDAYKNGKDVWAGGVEGAVAGLITGASVDLAVGLTIASGGTALAVIGTGVAVGIIGGATGAIVGDVTGQVMTNVRKKVTIGEAINNVSSENFKSKAIDGMVSGGVNGLTGGAFSVVGKAVSTSTQAIQSTMSKNITATAKTLSKQGASSDAVNAAVNTITKGMSKAGVNTISSMNKAEVAASAVTETTIKLVEEKRKNK